MPFVSAQPEALTAVAACLKRVVCRSVSAAELGGWR